MPRSELAGGLVVLVGAGPGEELLTTRAAIDWISRADIVIYDRLANPALLRHCRQDAELIYVGKTPGLAGYDQEGINALLVAKGKTGKLVVRLKGGDCFIFGRGGEEADALLEAGIPFRVVPGITAALAAGAYAGIPLTDRRHASSLALVTGQQDPEKAQSTINWRALAGIDTVVFYMGMASLPEIVAQFIAAGKDPKTPAAVVQEASTAYQRTVQAPLEEIVQAVQAAGIHPPALTIVGPVTAMCRRMGWFERLPLHGKTVLVTRPEGQAAELTAPLAELGAAVIEAPVLEIRPPQDLAEVDQVLRRLGQYELIAFTSANGVEMFVQRCRQLGLDGRALAGVRIAAVGPATVDALKANFLAAQIQPDDSYTTQGLAEAILAGGSWAGQRVLLARADIATPALPEALRAAGAAVDELVVYRTALPATLPEEAAKSLQAGQVDWITFTSSSSVRNLLKLAQSAGLPEEAIRRAKLAAIGPVTAQTLAELLRPADVVAQPHTAEGLVRAILKAVQGKS